MCIHNFRFLYYGASLVVNARDSIIARAIFEATDAHHNRYYPSLSVAFAVKALTNTLSNI
jgi:hypothetical protein